MRSRLYAVVSILLFGILYLFTAIGVVIVLLLALLRIKAPIAFYNTVLGKVGFCDIGKEIPDYRKRKYQ